MNQRISLFILLFCIGYSCLWTQEVRHCYLELDRQIYQAGSNLWFTTSFWDEEGIDLEQSPDHVLFALINENKEIVDLHYYDTSEGFSQNAYYLAKSLAPGNYFATVFPAQLPGVKPYAPIYRPLEVRKQLLSSVVVDHFWQESKTGKNLRVEVKKRLDESGLRSEMVLEGSSNRVQWDSVLLTRTAGKGVRDIELSPGQIAAYRHWRLKVRTAQDTLIQRLRSPLENALQMEVFPAGGVLVYGQESTLGIRLSREDGSAVLASGHLLENGEIIRSLTTDTKGLAHLNFRPQKDKTYMLAFGTAQEEIRRPLTKELFGAYGMEVVKVESDSLELRLNALGGVEKARLLVEAGDHLVGEHPLTAREGESNFRMPIPRGRVLELHLEINGRRVASQRIVKNTREDRLVLEASLVDAPEYYQSRDPVQMELQLKDKTADSGQEEVFYAVKSVSYLNKRDLAGADLNEFLRKDRYKERGEWMIPRPGFFWLIEAKEPAWSGHLPFHETPTLIEGSIFQKGKRGLVPSGSTTYLLLSESGMYTQFTRPNGSFFLPVVELKSRAGEQLILKPSCSDCSVQLTNTKDHLKKSLAEYVKKVHFELPVQTDDQQFDARIQEQISLSGMNYLEEVVVTKRKKSRSAGDLNRFGQFMGVTGDYVCSQYDILNCINHRGGGYPPEDGKYYRTNGGGRVLYRKPRAKSTPQDLFKINPFAVLEGFYPKQYFDSPDYSRSKENGVVDQRQTLFWNPAFSAPSTGSKKITFYTGDFPGIYSIEVIAFTRDGRSASAELEIRVY